jgi:tetratricopeptide (TPR) repeat protein
MRDVPRAEQAGLIGDVAGGLARTLVVELGDAVAADARRLSPHQVQADDLAMQAMAEFLRSVSQPAFERARQIFESSLRIDPECYRCVAGVSLTNSNLVMWEWAPDRQAAIARAEETLAHAALLNPDRLLTRLAQASLANIRRDWAGLLDAGDRLVEHFPAEPASHHHRCSALLRLGRFEESIDACARAARISPRDSRLATWQGLMGFNEFQRGRHAEAEQQLRASVRANPRVPFYGVVLAAAIAEQGRRDEAVQVLQETIARHPDYTRARIVNYWVATDSRFLAGRDRLVAVAGELGMP